MSINFWDYLTLWLYIIGISSDVIVAIIAVINVRNKNLSESNKAKLERSLEWAAVFSAIVILMAFFSEKKLDKLQAADFEQQIQNLKNNQPRSLTPMQQLMLERSVNWMPNKPLVKINLSIDADDAENLGWQLQKVFVKAGFQVDSPTLGIIGGMAGRRGIFVGQTNQIANEIVANLNQFGFTATNDISLITTNEIFIDIEIK